MGTVLFRNMEKMSAFTLGLLSGIDLLGSFRAMRARERAILDLDEPLKPGDFVSISRRIVYADGSALSSDFSWVVSDLQSTFERARVKAEAKTLNA